MFGALEVGDKAAEVVVVARVGEGDLAEGFPDAVASVGFAHIESCWGGKKEGKDSYLEGGNYSSYQNLSSEAVERGLSVENIPFRSFETMLGRTMDLYEILYTIHIPE